MRKILTTLINLLLTFLLYCCGEVVTQIDDVSFEHLKHVYVNGCYLVEHINSEVNCKANNTDYFYSNGRGVFRYSLKEGITTACVFIDDLQYTIEDFAVWNDYIYYVRENSEECELWKCNYETGEETMLLSDDDITMYNDGEKLKRGIYGRSHFYIDIYEDYLFYSIYYEPEYICPVEGDILKDSFCISTLFEDDNKSGDIRETEFEGINIKGHYDFEHERYETIEIRGRKGEKILYTYNQDNILVNGKRVNFVKEPGTYNFQYSFEGEEEQHDIECLCEEKYEYSKIQDEHLTVENGKIIGMISVSRHPNIDSYLYQSNIDSDILFDLDIETGESEILYDTKSNQEKIIGYEDGTLYLVRGGKVYSHLLDGGQEKELFDLPAEKEYIIDWQAGYLIIRDEDSSNGKEGDKIISYQISNE